jgi:hypothetical protein
MSELKTEDFIDFNTAEKRIYALMRDGRWYRAQTIIERSGQREGLRRMRNLRAKSTVDGIERKRLDGREWAYRLRMA